MSHALRWRYSDALRTPLNRVKPMRTPLHIYRSVPQRRHRIPATTAVILVLAGLLTAAFGQEMAVPVALQVKLLGKILTFDRNLESGQDSEVVVGVLYQTGFRASADARDAFMDGVESSGTAIGSRLRCVPIELGDFTDSANVVQTSGLDVLYVPPLRAASFEAITSISRQRGITTFTGVPDYVEEGIAVGIGTRGGKPRIHINLDAAKAEGADFDSRLLKLAKIIRG